MAHHLGQSARVAGIVDGADDLVDDALVARIRAGDAQAFEILFRTYHAGVRAFILGTVGSAAIADEVVQDVFLALWTHRERWHPPGSPRSYIYRAARNAALNVVRADGMGRRWASLVEYGGGASGMAEMAHAADEMLEMAESTMGLEQAIQSLPPRCREVFLLKWRDSLKYTEIAEVTGMSVKTVENQLMRALKLLRGRVRR